MTYTNEDLIHHFAPSRRPVPSTQQQPPTKAANNVSPAVVAAIVGIMLLIPVGLFGLKWWKSRSASSKIVVQTSPTPTPESSPTVASPSPVINPSPVVEPSVRPSLKPIIKPLLSPLPSGSPTATGNTDLSVDDITFEDAQSGAAVSSPFYAGQRVTFRAKLRNNGKSDTAPFASSWTINGSTVCSNSSGKVKAESQATYDDVNSLTCTSWLKQGDNTVIYSVDTANSLKESNTNNNTANKILTAQSTRTDLEASNIQFYQQGTTNAVSSPGPGQKLTARATFKNSGQEKQNNFSLRWLYNNTEVKKIQVNSWLNPGSTAEEATGYDFTAATGSATVRFELNSENVFPEINTGNNGFTKSLAL